MFKHDELFGRTHLSYPCCSKITTLDRSRIRTRPLAKIYPLAIVLLKALHSERTAGGPRMRARLAQDCVTGNTPRPFRAGNAVQPLEIRLEELILHTYGRMRAGLREHCQSEEEIMVSLIVWRWRRDHVLFFRFLGVPVAVFGG